MKWRDLTNEGGDEDAENMGRVLGIRCIKQETEKNKEKKKNGMGGTFLLNDEFESVYTLYPRVSLYLYLNEYREQKNKKQTKPGE